MSTPAPTPPDAPARPSRSFVAFAVLGSPAAWVLHLAMSYYVVPRACAAGTPLGLHLVTVGTAAVAVAAIVAAARLRAGAGGADPVMRTLGTVGLLVGALFLLATLVEGIPAAFVDPCR